MAAKKRERRKRDRESDGDKKSKKSTKKKGRSELDLRKMSSEVLEEYARAMEQKHTQSLAKMGLSTNGLMHGSRNDAKSALRGAAGQGAEQGAGQGAEQGGGQGGGVDLRFKQPGAAIGGSLGTFSDEQMAQLMVMGIHPANLAGGLSGAAAAPWWR